MHIVHQNLVFQPVASGRALVELYVTLSSLAARQAAAGARVTVLQRFHEDVTFDMDGVRYELLRDPGWRSAGRSWMLAARLAARAARLAPDVLHLHGTDFAVQTRTLRLALSRRAALAVQDHGAKPTVRRRMKRVRRALLASADGVLINAIEMGPPLRDAGVLPLGVPCFAVRESSSTFERMPQPDARRATGLSGDPLVLWVGRLEPGKDPLTAIEGFCLMARTSPGARLAVVYQQAGELPAVQALLARYEVAHRVTFVGTVAHEELHRYYSSADLFLTSSHWEGSNYALIESMACGAWPVCSNNPSHRGMLAGGTVGHLFEKGEATSCAAALRDAAGVSADVRLARPQQVRAHFDRSLSWDAVVRQSFDAYRAMLEARFGR